MAVRAATAWGLLLGTALAGLVLGACRGPGDDLPEAVDPNQPGGVPRGPSEGGRTLGRDGGRLVVWPFSLDVPAGALSQPVHIHVRPVAPGSPGLPMLAVTTPMQVEPADLVLLRPARLTYATGLDVGGLAVARLAGPVWQPLPGQGNSPGLAWAESARLGTFALAPSACCGTDGSMGGPCEARCDVGPLHYLCQGPSGAVDCCDPFARDPQPDPMPLCP